MAYDHTHVIGCIMRTSQRCHHWWLCDILRMWEESLKKNIASDWWIMLPSASPNHIETCFNLEFSFSQISGTLCASHPKNFKWGHGLVRTCELTIFHKRWVPQYFLSSFRWILIYFPIFVPIVCHIFHGFLYFPIGFYTYSIPLFKKLGIEMIGPSLTSDFNITWWNPSHFKIFQHINTWLDYILYMTIWLYVYMYILYTAYIYIYIYMMYFCIRRFVFHAYFWGDTQWTSHCSSQVPLLRQLWWSRSAATPSALARETGEKPGISGRNGGFIGI